MPGSSAPEELFVRIYLDRHVKTQLALDLRNQGFDALTTQEAGMDTALDEAQLDFARAGRRAILTFNIRDFALLHQNWTASNQSHCGIIVSQQLGNREYGILLRRMLRLLNALSASELQNNFVHLAQFKE